MLTEIDHNFSQAHRIVTTSILPVVEQYAENSRDVWEGAKVSLSPPVSNTKESSLNILMQYSSGNNSSKQAPTSPSPATRKNQTKIPPCRKMNPPRRRETQLPILPKPRPARMRTSRRSTTTTMATTTTTSTSATNQMTSI